MKPVIQSLLASFVVLVLGFGVHRRSVSEILKNKVSEDTLVSMGTLAALVQSFMLWFRKSDSLGFEVSALGMTSFLVTKFLVGILWEKKFLRFGIRSQEILDQFTVPRSFQRMNFFRNRGFFVTFVMFFATLASGLQFYFRDNPDLAFNVFVSVIFVASPWAIDFAVPGAFWVALSAGEVRQVVFKDLRFFENVSKIKKIFLVNLKEIPFNLNSEDKNLAGRLRELGIEIVIQGSGKDSSQDSSRDSGQGSSQDSGQGRKQNFQNQIKIENLFFQIRADGSLSSQSLDLPRGFQDLALALVMGWLVHRQVRINMTFVLLYNFLALSAAALGFFSPLWAVFVMCLSVLGVLASHFLLLNHLKRVET